MLHVLYDPSTTIVNTLILNLFMNGFFFIVFCFQIVAHSLPHNTYDAINLLTSEGRDYLHDPLQKTQTG